MRFLKMQIAKINTGTDRKHKQANCMRETKQVQEENSLLTIASLTCTKGQEPEVVSGEFYQYFKKLIFAMLFKLVQSTESKGKVQNYF